MPLTGTPFLIIVIVLTVVGLGVTVYFWPSFARPGWTWILLRGVSILGTNLLVLLVAAVILNDQYEFYVDWGDLFNSQTGVQHSVVAGASPAAAVGVRVPPTNKPAFAAGALPAGVTGGKPFWITLTGPASGVTARALVVLPDTYFSPTFSQERYPVIEAFHGYPGSPESWIYSVLDLPGHVRQLVISRQMRESIIVIPEILIPGGTDSECVNIPGGAQVETWIAEDVPSWVEQTLRAQPSRDSWATIGFSFGAYCAALVTVKHPDQFGAAIAIAGYYKPLFPPGPNRYDSALQAPNNLIDLVRNAPPPIALWVSTSSRDTLSYDSTLALIASTRAPTAVTAIFQKKVGHRVSAWIPLVDQSLTWLGQNVSGFAPIK